MPLLMATRTFGSEQTPEFFCGITCTISNLHITKHINLINAHIAILIINANIPFHSIFLYLHFSVVAIKCNFLVLFSIVYSVLGWVPKNVVPRSWKTLILLWTKSLQWRHKKDWETTHSGLTSSSMIVCSFCIRSVNSERPLLCFSSGQSADGA